LLISVIKAPHNNVQEKGYLRRNRVIENFENGFQDADNMTSEGVALIFLALSIQSPTDYSNVSYVDLITDKRNQKHLMLVYCILWFPSNNIVSLKQELLYFIGICTCSHRIYQSILRFACSCFVNLGGGLTSDESWSILWFLELIPLVSNKRSQV